MTIESKPLLILQMMAFTALIKNLTLERKCMPLKCDDDLKRIKVLEHNISESEIMLEVVTNELNNKHNHG